MQRAGLSGEKSQARLFQIVEEPMTPAPQLTPQTTPSPADHVAPAPAMPQAVNITDNQRSAFRDPLRQCFWWPRMPAAIGTAADFNSYLASISSNSGSMATFAANPIRPEPINATANANFGLAAGLGPSSQQIWDGVMLMSQVNQANEIYQKHVNAEAEKYRRSRSNLVKENRKLKKENALLQEELRCFKQLYEMARNGAPIDEAVGTEPNEKQRRRSNGTDDDQEDEQEDEEEEEEEYET